MTVFVEHFKIDCMHFRCNQITITNSFMKRLPLTFVFNIDVGMIFNQNSNDFFKTFNSQTIWNKAVAIMNSFKIYRNRQLLRAVALH